ncbi:hypothetical protein [Herbaspirillum sp. CF444]|uniref:hypothetical protein n=1 Tax=Herbaspirillum sp. CF444 TaxID=1144319 RepID=UPI0012FACA9E|nr:hypothetical protein [Herbaspirillum sp. CF444]
MSSLFVSVVDSTSFLYAACGCTPAKSGKHRRRITAEIHSIDSNASLRQIHAPPAERHFLVKTQKTFAVAAWRADFRLSYNAFRSHLTGAQSPCCYSEPS